MTKVLISWKGINARISADPKEAIKQISFLTQMAQEDLKSGKLKDLSVFAGGSAGYAIFEGNEVDLAWNWADTILTSILKLTWF
jgi:hypothetical protein